MLGNDQNDICPTFQLKRDSLLAVLGFVFVCDMSLESFRMILYMGAKSKLQKIPGPKFNPKKSNAEFPRHKNFQEALNDTTITNLHFEYPQKTLLKSHTPKNPCYNFSTPNNPDIKNFKPQTIRRSSLLLEIRSNIPLPLPLLPAPG